MSAYILIHTHVYYHIGSVQHIHMRTGTTCTVVAYLVGFTMLPWPPRATPQATHFLVWHMYAEKQHSRRTSELNHNVDGTRPLNHTKYTRV